QEVLAIGFMATQADLRRSLNRIDQQNYKAYKDLKGRYEFPGFTLLIDRVQGDPFASPSQCRVKIPQSQAAFPKQLYHNRSREVALRDYLTRQFDQVAQTVRQHRGSGSSGLLAIVQTGQTLLERTSAFIDDTELEVRFVVGLPAFGRRVAGLQAAEMLCDDLPKLVNRALLYSSVDAKSLQHHVETAEDADWLREHLHEKGLVAFVADGAILPRRSGVDDRPLIEASIPFQAPASLRVEFTCPNRGLVTGMGIPAGVTLIVGGGYHGKSTLLRAIELGVYNHIPQDGREQVITHPAAVKIRAEDGRSIVGVDISPFINHLPQGRSTTHFSTQNASGSTSQAANIIEALEADAKVLLVDEDTAATNFMIRDRRMQALIAKDKEPITPFIDKIRQLYTDYGVSTILVMGGSGDYFDVADTVIAMQDFQPQDVTAQAKAIAQQHTTARASEGGQKFGALTPRILEVNTVADDDRPMKRKVPDLDTIVLGREEIDLSAVEQVVEKGQLRAIAAAILYLQHHYLNGNRSLPEILDLILADIQNQGFDSLSFLPEGDFAAFRRFELAAAINRWRNLRLRRK
ncbi:MAG: ABC-ATPase domain-containing protein, partial [Kovacikia sp.]